MKKLLFAATCMIAFSLSAQAATITNGFTFSVADQFGGLAGVGTHFHSNTGGAFGNPAGLAEVGRLGDEEVRGLSEYDLTGLAAAATAFVTFDTYSLVGLFGQGGFSGTIAIESYAGDNTEDLSDFEAASIGSVGSFSTAGLAVGDVLSFDITSLFNSAIANGDTSFGIRLAAVPLNGAGAVVFNDFRLTTDNQSSDVPEPASALLVFAGIAALGAVRRRGQLAG